VVVDCRELRDGRTLFGETRDGGGLNRVVFVEMRGPELGKGSKKVLVVAMEQLVLMLHLWKSSIR
jgi:hypothetical protein